MFGLDRLAAALLDRGMRASQHEMPGDVGNPEEAFLVAEERRHAADDELLHPRRRRWAFRGRG
jgi:hypothetical protein